MNLLSRARRVGRRLYRKISLTTLSLEKSKRMNLPAGNSRIAQFHAQRSKREKFNAAFQVIQRMMRQLGP